ncbi:MAG: regulatory protein RecX [Saprospiraceae bacterium]
MPFRRPSANTKPDLSPDEILQRAEHFCAFRERSPQEVRDKLHALGARDEIAEQIYAILQTDGYFDETRFAQLFVGGKFRINRWGRVRIRQALYQHRLPDQVVERALATAIEEQAYLHTLKQLAEQKKAQLAGDPQIRQKTAAYLIRAGYEPELVFSNV